MSRQVLRRGKLVPSMVQHVQFTRDEVELLHRASEDSGLSKGELLGHLLRQHVVAADEARQIRDQRIVDSLLPDLDPKTRETIVCELALGEQKPRVH